MVFRQLAQDMRMPIRMTITRATKQRRPSRVASVLLRYRRRANRLWLQLLWAKPAQQPAQVWPLCSLAQWAWDANADAVQGPWLCYGTGRAWDELTARRTAQQWRQRAAEMLAAEQLPAQDIGG